MFNIKLEDGSRILLTGRFSASNSKEADEVFNTVSKDCIVDFKNLEYISSVGIGSIVKTYTRLTTGGHTLKLINLNNHVKEVFRFAGLDKVMNIE